MTDNIIDKWEIQGLGKGPFRCVGMFKMPNKETATIHDYMALPQGYGAGCCAVCGTGLVYNYMINSADGRKFVVGCDCVWKRGDTVVVNEMKKLKRDHEVSAKAAKKAAVTRARHNAERERNGGLTDHELLCKQREEGRAVASAAMAMEHKELFEAIQESGVIFAREMVAQCLQWGCISEKQLQCLRDVAARAAFNASAKNEHFGTLGARITIHLTVEADRWFESQEWGRPDSWLVILRDSEGRTFKYFGSARSKFPAKGESCDLVATIGSHEEYNGVKQTKLMRPAPPKSKAA